MALGLIKYKRHEGDLTMRKKLLKGLTEDQIAKVRACDNVSDLIQLAKDEGVELNAEQLAAVSGGACTPTTNNNNRRKYES